MPTPAHPAHHGLDIVIVLLRTPQLYWPVIAVIVGVLGRWMRRHWSPWTKGFRERKVRNWPSFSAVIDVVSVAERQDADKRYYLATLTYFFRNPELQMGDYQREFPSKEEAKYWAAQFKSRSVLIHLNPADRSDSVLLDRELSGLDVHAPPGPLKAHKSPSPYDSDDSLPEEGPQALSSGYRLLCGLAEIVSTAGLATCGVMLAVSIGTGGRLHPRQFYWICGSMLSCSLVAWLAVYIHLTRSEQGRWLLKSYSRWAPAWMRWSLKVTATLLATGYPLFDIFRQALSPVLHPWAKALAPHMPYLIGGWIFLISAAFQAAILRSQEELSVSTLVS